MKKQLDIKKLLILNLPYILMGLFATNFGEAWRMVQGADASQKALSLISVLPVALASWWPSLHPLDLLVGICCGGGLRLAVYLKSKNALVLLHAAGGAGRLVAQPAPAGFTGGPVLWRWSAAGRLSQEQERQEVPAWHGVRLRPMGNP